jgi:isocitrate dehydrogenase
LARPEDSDTIFIRRSSMSRLITKTPTGLAVPDMPIVPFIQGDGTGPDIWKAAQPVFDTAVEMAYGGKRKIQWLPLLAGEKAFKETGEWLPRETEEGFRTHLVGIKGPLTTPVGGGIRSLNVALRQKLDLYVCLRPVRYFPGVPSPLKKPEVVNMVVFRENTEDVYAGFEVREGTQEARTLAAFLSKTYGWAIREDAGIGIKPISRFGSQRLVRAAILYAISHGRKCVTLVHKGNIQKFTEGAFREWGYELAKEEFPANAVIAGDPSGVTAASELPPGKVLIKDAIADSFLQQILLRPEDHEVIATTNLNGDYISDALAAQVGGIGIAPGANINYMSGHAIFEATHGTAPKYAGKDMANPCSLILSGQMMLDYLGWKEAAAFIEKGVISAISQGFVTYDFARLLPSATQVSTSRFGEKIVENMRA